MKTSNPYRAAGTFDGVSYVEREADFELLKKIEDNRYYPYFLAPRQSGKSSLIKHTISKLDKNRFKVAVIDLTSFPYACREDYNSFMKSFIDELSRNLKIFQKTINGDDLRDVLKSIISSYSERLIVFVDEIDWLTDVEFKDDFFSNIRFLFNLRADDESFLKVQFVLSGAALPTELISRENVSPFNVGSPILLNDLSQKQVSQMVEFLSEGARQVNEDVSTIIYEYTGGSVYLSQLILDMLWELGDKRVISTATVDEVVEKIIDEASRNVHFINIIQTMASNSEILQAYQDLKSGRPVSDSSYEYLKMTGLFDVQRAFRNLIYQKVFAEDGPLSLSHIIEKKHRGFNKLIEEFSNRLFGFRKPESYEVGIQLYSPLEIKLATKYYIVPDCMSFDPAQAEELRYVLTTRENMFQAMDKILETSPESRYILLLADSGMGKTSFVLNYYVRNKRKRKSKRQKLAIVSLSMPNSNKYIAGLRNKRETVLFLDGFDEDPKAMMDHQKRLSELMKLCTEFSRVIITCRTQFFPRNEELPLETGILRIAPRRAGEVASYQFNKLYLAPLTDAQVERFIRKRYPFWQQIRRKKARWLSMKTPLLSVRPMLLAHIPDLIKSGRPIKYSFQVYEIMIDAWLERERFYVKEKYSLREFSEILAIDLFLKRHERGAERIYYTELEPLARSLGIELTDWQLRGRSLLNRDHAGYYKFAHRFIMEYLFVIRFLKMKPEFRFRIGWTDHMKYFLKEIISDCRDKKLPIPDLTFVDMEGILHLRSQPITISANNVETMLKNYNFFDSSYNENGKGIEHKYENRNIKGDEVVLDHVSNLMWQKEGSSNSLTFKESKKYIMELNHIGYAGYRDWRIPTLEEAMNLMEQKQSDYGLFIDPVFDKQRLVIWTADLLLGTAGQWIVSFIHGSCSWSILDMVNYVRAVRSSQSSMEQFGN
jgi:hypothetical protein